MLVRLFIQYYNFSTVHSMKVKPYKEEVIQLLLKFLENELGETQIADKLRKKHIQNIPSWVLQNNELLKKGLTKVIKAYVQMDKNIKQYYVNRKAPQESQQSEQEQKPKVVQKVTKKKERKASLVSNDSSANKNKKSAPKQQKPKGYDENTTNWVKSKFEPPKKLQQIGKEEEPVKIVKPKKPSMIAKEASSEDSSARPLHSDHSDDQQEVKKLKKYNKKVIKEQKAASKKVAKKKEESSQESSQQQQPKPVKKGKKQVKKEIKQQKQQEKVVEKKKRKNSEQKTHHMHTRLDDKMQDEAQEDENDENVNSQANKKSHPFSAFSRIKVDEVGPIKTQLQDNSFEAKFKFGKGGDEWGKYGHERLKDTRGDSFKKTKDKLKNKAYQGGTIDINVINSIPID